MIWGNRSIKPIGAPMGTQVLKISCLWAASPVMEKDDSDEIEEANRKKIPH